MDFLFCPEMGLGGKAGSLLLAKDSVPLLYIYIYILKIVNFLSMMSFLVIPVEYVYGRFITVFLQQPPATLLF